MKKGITVPKPEWWKHLKWNKRVFWKKQRKAFKDEANYLAAGVLFNHKRRDGC